MSDIVLDQDESVIKGPYNASSSGTGTSYVLAQNMAQHKPENWSSVSSPDSLPQHSDSAQARIEVLEDIGRARQVLYGFGDLEEVQNPDIRKLLAENLKPDMGYEAQEALGRKLDELGAQLSGDKIGAVPEATTSTGLPAPGSFSDGKGLVQDFKEIMYNHNNTARRVIWDGADPDTITQPEIRALVEENMHDGMAYEDKSALETKLNQFVTDRIGEMEAQALDQKTSDIERQVRGDLEQIEADALRQAQEADHPDGFQPR